ncbi:hypothetical protein HID58_018042 [Brassica napus]|uniref:non-specific serine/threonine protein kinase n=1 Tax=Brassica napus TaxID=3708 RepID=A0ABQ8D8U7_BRANA|nr:hypothetical protein HID58_018042 [Brassica napus]
MPEIEIVADDGDNRNNNALFGKYELGKLLGCGAFAKILSKKGYDGAKVDVWSCGIVLFVLAAGFLPFNDPNLMNMYKKIYKGTYRCPRWMSQDLKRFISRLLDINPETRITIDEILKDPWFVKGGLKTIKFHDEVGLDNGAVKGKEDGGGGGEYEVVKSLNAFDLISFSSGLDLSGLFDGCSNSVGEPERFLSEKSPEKLAEEVEEFAKVEKLRVNKKKEEFEFEMEGPNGKFTIGIYISRLNDLLVVVEARRRGGEVDCYKEMWNDKLRLQLIRVTDQTPNASI